MRCQGSRGRATVVSAAKAAYDTAFYLMDSGVQVNWVIRENSLAPLVIMPHISLGVAHTMDVVATEIIGYLN